MNRIPSRGRSLKRIAAATAIAVGAALIATPGASQAATVDCAALGDNPSSAELASALETAINCDVEVRVSSRNGSYATLFATPQGQLRLVATVDPALARPDGTYADPTLVERDGSLTQTLPSTIWLGTSDPAKPLVRFSGATLDWAGATPDPTFEGTTARYDELANGLDLAVDIATHTAELRFSAADADAWSDLATGLTVPAIVGRNVSIVDSAINWEYMPEPGRSRIGTTPFTVRDAAGVTTPVELTLTADGALTLNLPEDVLATAAYPLELSAQIGATTTLISDWGSVTSAEPDVAIYRGEAGFDTPYFKAAGETGDAIVGGYCDALADETCDPEAEAESYWGFSWPYLQEIAAAAGFGYEFDFPVVSAEFSVDAADGTACIAPDLSLSERYTPSTTWNRRPAAVSAAVTGNCDEGKAHYDVSSELGSAWEHPEPFDSVTFGMTDSIETARFNGGSGRLDVYLDARGFTYSGPHDSICGESLAAAPFFDTAKPEYGDISIGIWRPDITDPEFTWTAKFIDDTTGETVLRTDPRAAELDSSPSYTLADRLPDGQYRVEYEVVSEPLDFSFRSEPCYIVVDTSAPEFIDVTVESGQRYVGDTLAVKVSVADNGFPDGLNELTVSCQTTACSVMDIDLTEGGEFHFDFTIDETDGSLVLILRDKAGNFAERFVINLPATYSQNDYDGDRDQDLFTVRKSDGALLFHAGKGDGTFADGVVTAASWGHMTVTMAQDLTSDGIPDLLARDDKTGILYTYPGNGKGGFGTRIKAGSGWNSMRLFSAGDYWGISRVDLRAVRRSDGALFSYAGKGDGTFGIASQLGGAWTGRVDMLVNLGNIIGEYGDEFLVRDARTGGYQVYAGGSHQGMVDLSTLPDSSFNSRTFSGVVSVGDVDGDNYSDLVAIDANTGELVRESFYYDYGLHSITVDEVIATGWQKVRLPSAAVDRAHDYSGDGRTDLIARNSSSGTTYLYPGNGSGGFGSRVSWGSNLKNLNLIETAGDLDGDGFSDLIGRVASTGALYFFPGKGDGTYDYAARKRIGTGWNSMSAIVSGHDYNGDGKVDILAREKSTGYLWLYPGKGDGPVGTRVKVGTGWNALRDITAAGDLDHDGHADVLAIRSSDNCMYFYGGRGNGTLKPGVKMSCNWVGYDQAAAVGDFNGDGHADWVSRRNSDGALYLYKGNGEGGYSSRALIGTGWNSMNIIA